MDGKQSCWFKCGQFLYKRNFELFLASQTVHRLTWIPGKGVDLFAYHSVGCWSHEITVLPCMGWPRFSVLIVLMWYVISGFNCFCFPQKVTLQFFPCLTWIILSFWKNLTRGENQYCDLCCPLASATNCCFCSLSQKVFVTLLLIISTTILSFSFNKENQ